MKDPNGRNPREEVKKARKETTNYLGDVLYVVDSYRYYADQNKQTYT